MPKVHRFALLAALFVIRHLNACPPTAGAAGFNQFIVFGDSTLDTGYFANHPSGSPTFDASMMTALQSGNSGGWAGNGVMNTTMLAERFGLTALPLGHGGGTNYANGGATTVDNPESMVPDNVCTLSQIENYLTSVNGVANPNALYLIKTGDNDVTLYYSPAQTAFRQANPTYLSDGATALADRVANLQAAGARTIVVRNSYDSALFAGPGGDIRTDLAPVLAASRSLGDRSGRTWHNVAYASFPWTTTAYSVSSHTIPPCSVSHRFGAVD